MQCTAIFHRCENDNFQMKNCDAFRIFAQNIDCVHSSEYQQSMFKGKNKIKIVYPYNPQFYYDYNIGVRWGMTYTGLLS